MGWMVTKQNTLPLLYGLSELCDEHKGAKNYMKDHQAGHTTFCDENYRTWNISFQPLNYEEKSGVISKHEKVVQAAN